MTVMKNISVLPELVDQKVAKDPELKVFEDELELAKKNEKEKAEI